MRKPPARSFAREPGCDEHAAGIAAAVAERALQANFRPIADFDRCGILGYLAAVRGPNPLLVGSYARLADMARRCGLLREFSRGSIAAILARFIECRGSGLVFVPLPDGAVEELGCALAESIRDTADGVGYPPERVAIVVPDIAAEHLAAAAEFAARLRACGFRIAARGFACALSDRRLWSQVPPDFILLDRDLFEGVELATVRDEGFAALLADAAARGWRVVADGIAGANDFKALQRLGIAYGAGDFIGRCGLVPTHAMPAAAYKEMAAACKCADGAHHAPGGVLVRLLTKIDPVGTDTCAEDVFARFENNADLRAVAVVEDGAPRGLISRYEMVDNMARPFRHELYGRKPCTRFMDPQPLVIDIGVSLAELSAIVVGAHPRHLVSGFIVTDRGHYLGMGSVQDLVREVTAMQMAAAKYANPLTQLPGNVPINQHIDNLLAAAEECCIAYCDLDHFKPFNDVYGYAKGDEVIQLTAQVLGEACDAGCDFVGHIGGDDFVAIFRSRDWEARCNAALARFGDEILGFFSNDDIERGGYLTENRKGQMEFHCLTALSIGAVEVASGMFRNHLQVSVVAAEVKKRAKAIPGNSLFVNRRLYHNDAAPATAGAPREKHEEAAA